jgi:SAM-dependent methyltransferase
VFDWSDGTYELTAAALRPAADALVRSAAPRPGEDALDLGCGTGNVAAALVAAGARVVGVDPAARLVEVARGAVPGATFLEGRAEALPLPARSVDLAVSSFALIFCPEPARAAAELARVLRPGGRLVMSSWAPTGPIFAASVAMMEVAARHWPPAPPRPAWGDPAFLRATFEAVGAEVEVTANAVSFPAASAGAWFAEQEAHHPAWRAVRASLAAHEGAWDEVRERSVAALGTAGPPWMSPWWCTTARFPA